MNMMRYLDNMPFAILMAVICGVFAGTGVLLVNGDPNFAGFVGFLGAMAGLAIGIFKLRKRGLPAMATMMQFADTEDK